MEHLGNAVHLFFLWNLRETCTANKACRIVVRSSHVPAIEVLLMRRECDPPRCQAKSWCHWKLTKVGLFLGAVVFCNASGGGAGEPSSLQHQSLFDICIRSTDLGHQKPFRSLGSSRNRSNQTQAGKGPVILCPCFRSRRTDATVWAVQLVCATVRATVWVQLVAPSRLTRRTWEQGKRQSFESSCLVIPFLAFLE